MFAIIDDAIEQRVVNHYYNTIAQHYKHQLEIGSDPTAWYPTKNIRLAPDDSIVRVVQHILESNLKVKLTCSDVEMQTWNKGVRSDRHRHDAPRHPLYVEGEDYNTMLYLNDDFDGGEFYMENGITVKPVTGRLTFFRGDQIYHGINPVHRNDRHTIIFWWKHTKEIR
jgi:hypothetical protein